MRHKSLLSRYKFTKALKNIVKESNIPIVADIHFHYKRAIEAAEMGANCLRINPGNIGSKERLLEVVVSCKSQQLFYENRSECRLFRKIVRKI